MQTSHANAILEQNATKQQPAPGYTFSTRAPTFLEITSQGKHCCQQRMHLQQNEVDMVCSIGLDISNKPQQVRQASTLSEPCRGGAKSHTDKQSDTTKEKKKKVAGAHTLCCDTLTYLTDYVTGCHGAGRSPIRGSHGSLC